MNDVEAIERATVAGVAPRASEERPGWLLPLDPGEVGRACSAVPLRHHGIDPADIAAISARYQAHARRPRFRLADVAGLEATRAALAARGFAACSPTSQQLSAADAVLARSPAGEVELAAAPDDAWTRVFVATPLRSGTSVEERAAMLTRVPGCCFASVREAGETIAVGAMTFAHGLASVQGMRTLTQHRGRGLAARLLGALARAALARGAPRMILQVETDNQAGLALYRRAGFEALWQYRYWLMP